MAIKLEKEYLIVYFVKEKRGRRTWSEAWRETRGN